MPGLSRLFCDRVRANGKVGTHQTGGVFMSERRMMIERLQHRDFMPFIPGDWEPEIVAVKAREYGTPDS